MAGKKGLIMGLANDKSIAWGIAQALDAQGAQIAISYQNEALEKRVVPLAEKLSFAPTLIKCDVTDSASVEACFKELGEKWGKIDFVVHAIAFSDKDQLKGRTIDTTLENFTNTMHISCYSFLEACRCASPYMNENGAIVTLTYLGSERVLPNYNIMGVAKAALDRRFPQDFALERTERAAAGKRYAGTGRPCRSGSVVAARRSHYRRSPAR